MSVTPLVEKSIETAIGLLVSGSFGWLLASLRVDAKITSAVARVREEIGALREERHAKHRELDVALIARFKELEEKIAEASQELNSFAKESGTDFAKAAEVGLAIVELRDQCRSLLACVSKMEGRIEAVIEMGERRR